MTDHNRNAEPGERRRLQVSEELWLSYYNDALYARGVISREDRDRMRRRIQARGGDRAH